MTNARVPAKYVNLRFLLLGSAQPDDFLFMEYKMEFRASAIFEIIYLEFQRCLLGASVLSLKIAFYFLKLKSSKMYWFCTMNYVFFFLFLLIK